MKKRLILSIASALSAAMVVLVVLGFLSDIAGLVVDMPEALHFAGITVDQNAISWIVSCLLALLAIVAIWTFAFALMHCWKWLPWQESLAQTPTIPKLSDGVSEARAMIQELIDTAPTGRLNRSELRGWRDRCIRTLRALFPDEYEWADVLGELVGAEDSSRKTPKQVRDGIDAVLIHLRSLRARCHPEMLRKDAPEGTGSDYEGI